MLTLAFPAAVFETNCYVLATGEGQECLVVDPGIGVLDTLREVLETHRLKPTAVLLTHGHADHVWSVTPVCGGSDAAVLPAYIHSEDRYRLRDPLGDLGSPLRAMLAQQFGVEPTWQEPSNVVEVGAGESLTVAGLDLAVLHAPGHTEGSVMFRTSAVPEGVADQVQVSGTVITGDVLFAGSIGRTDLAGGSAEAMDRSLREVVLPLPDDLLILPGHGPASTMGRERATNPYLQGLRP